MQLCRLILSLALGLSTTAAIAQNSATPPATSVFFNYPEIQSVRLAPDGNHLGMIVRSKEGRLALATCDASDLKQCRFILRGEDADVFSFFWINSNRLMVRTVNTQEEDDRNDNVWYAANADGTGIRPFRPTGSYFIGGAINDGSSDIIVEHITGNQVDGSIRNIQPFRYDTESGQIKEILHIGDPAESRRWVFDRDGNPRVMFSIKGLTESVYYLNKDGTKWQELGTYDLLAGDPITPTAFGFDDSLYVQAKQNSGTTALYKYDVTSGKIASQPTVDLAGFDYNGSIEVDYKARKVLGFHYETDARGTAWIDPFMKSQQALIDASLPNTVNDISCSNCLTGRYMVVTAGSDRQPPVYYLFDTESKQLHRIGESRPAIQAAQMGQKDFFKFKARDGMEIPVYVTTPPGWHSGPSPTVVMVHGGPWARGSSWEWEGISQFLATRGYAVIEPQFRGSTGFGDKLWKSSFKQWGLAMQDDLADAATWATAKGYADPKRIAIGGASYGGYATLMGLIKNPEIFKCGFEWVGVTDIRFMFNEVWNDASIEQLNFSMKTMIGDPDADATQLAQTSPVDHASELHQPLLMAYGGKDRRVPIAQGVAFANAVEATNKKVEFLSYPDEGHGWAREPDNVDFWNHVDAFLDKNLKNP